MRGYPVQLLALSVVAAAALAGCAVHAPKLVTLAERPCPNGGFRQTAELVFSRVSANGKDGVSEAAFSKFLDGQVSPLFPQGLTVIDAGGRWTPPPGSMIRTPAKMVMIVLPGNADDGKKLDTVRLAYKTQFHQPSALLMTNGDCLAF